MPTTRKYLKSSLSTLQSLLYEAQQMNQTARVRHIKRMIREYKIAIKLTEGK